MQLVLKTPDAAASNVQAGQSEVGKRSAWDLRAVTMQEWIDLWAPILSINLLHPRRPEDGTNMLQSRARGGLVGARFATGCELFRHGYAQRDVSGGVVSVQRLHSGFAALEFSNSNYVHRPGTITITDFKQRFRGSHHNAEIEQVMIPRSELGLTDADPVAPIVIDVDSQRGRQIALQLERYFARSGDEAFEPENLITLIKSEIQESWTPVSDREEWWIGRRNLIRKYIDTHLEDPNLGPRQICELFNMSRATLYRMFELDGGVRRRIQDRRLFSAIWDLATGGIRRGRLSHAQENIEKNSAGIAIANALAGSTWLQSNERVAFSANWGHYDGHDAVAFSGAARLGRNISANAAIGTLPDRGEIGARAGVRFGW